MYNETFHLPSGREHTPLVWRFGPSAGASTWQVWQKPPGYSMCSIVCIGAGGGGSGGAVNFDGTGGGGGGVMHAIYSHARLPETLYVLCLPGGNGGASGGNGAAGPISFVSVAPNTATHSVLCASSATDALGGIFNTPSTAANTATGTTYPLTTQSAHRSVAGGPSAATYNFRPSGVIVTGGAYGFLTPGTEGKVLAPTGTLYLGVEQGYTFQQPTNCLIFGSARAGPREGGGGAPGGGGGGGDTTGAQTGIAGGSGFVQIVVW